MSRRMADLDVCSMQFCRRSVDSAAVGLKERSSRRWERGGGRAPMVFSRSARGRVRAGFASAVAGVVATLGFAGVASASCPDQQSTQPFAPWGDAAQYVAAPDGGFEAGATGWQLSGGAAVQD